MNTRTGELFENMDEARKKALMEGISEAVIDSELIPLDDKNYERLTGMNRAQRRQWAREHKKDK